MSDKPQTAAVNAAGGVTHAALVSAYPTEAKARAGIARDLDNPTLGEYRGIWRTPMGAIVHLFSDLPTEQLTGLTLVSSALPGDADARFLLDRAAEPS
jgi:hypothetical protein